jgi:hypothetical protein
MIMIYFGLLRTPSTKWQMCGQKIRSTIVKNRRLPIITTQQKLRIILANDVEENPGPNPNSKQNLFIKTYNIRGCNDI